MPRTIRAPRGTQLTCKNWLIEAAYRMLQNNLDPEVAFDPDHLIVYGGRGKAARNWDCFDAILRSLEQLEPDETLLVQSGKPVAVFRTHEDAPRVLIANSNIVPHWATQENFDRWEQQGLIMYGQMTAGSWIYIGTQGILQGTYETFGSLARQQGWPSLKGKFVLTAGLGEMGGAQPLAVTMNERRGPGRRGRSMAHRAPAAASLPGRGHRQPGGGDDLGRGGQGQRRGQEHRPAGQRGRRAAGAGGARHRAGRGHRPDQRARPADGLHPGRLHAADAPPSCASRTVKATSRRPWPAWRCTWRRCWPSSGPARSSSTTATTCASGPSTPACKDAFAYPGFVPAFIRPLFCEGSGPFRWVALSGDPEDIRVTDRIILDLFPENEHLRAGSPWPRSGSRSRACRRASAGCATASGPRPAWPSTRPWPTAASRRPSSSAATTWTAARWPAPTARPRACCDGSDAISDWPILNALVNAVGGATWVSFHHGGGVGIGYSQHAGQVIVADGTRSRRPPPGARPHHRPRHGRRAPRRRRLSRRRLRLPKQAGVKIPMMGG